MEGATHGTGTSTGSKAARARHGTRWGSHRAASGREGAGSGHSAPGSRQRAASSVHATRDGQQAAGGSSTCGEPWAANDGEELANDGGLQGNLEDLCTASRKKYYIFSPRNRPTLSQSCMPTTQAKCDEHPSLSLSVSHPNKPPSLRKNILWPCRHALQGTSPRNVCYERLVTSSPNFPVPRPRNQPRDYTYETRSRN